MEKQYLYILSNPRYENLFKIGGTNKNPAIRADQLSRQTGTIGKFQVEWSIVVPDWRVAEQMAHYLLREQAEEKEYFKLDMLQSTEMLMAKLTQFFELTTTEIYASESLKKEVKIIDFKGKAQEILKKLKEEQELEKLEKELEKEAEELLKLGYL